MLNSARKAFQRYLPNVSERALLTADAMLSQTTRGAHTMNRLAELKKVFQAEDFQQFTVKLDGSITIEFRGCVHATLDGLLRYLCEKVEFVELSNNVEIWRIVPMEGQRSYVLDVLRDCWLSYTAPVVLPLMTFENVTNVGWAFLSDVRSADQVKTAINLLVMGHAVSVYNDQENARYKALGVTGGINDVALRVDDKVILVSPSGYVYNTSLSGE